MDYSQVSYAIASLFTGDSATSEHVTVRLLSELCYHGTFIH
jgi:hypothetical protein